MIYAVIYGYFALEYLEYMRYIRCIKARKYCTIKVMTQRTIAFREPQGYNLKKIAHSLEMNVSELITAALREYLNKRNIEV